MQAISPFCVAPFSSAVRTRPQTPNQHTKTTLNMDKASLRLSGRVSVTQRARVRVSALRNSRKPRLCTFFSQRALIFQRGQSGAANRARRGAARRRERAKMLLNEKYAMTDAEFTYPSPQLTGRRPRQRPNRQREVHPHRLHRLCQRWHRVPQGHPRFLPR